MLDFRDPIEQALEHTSFHSMITIAFLEAYHEHRPAVPLEILVLAIPMALHAPTRWLVVGNKASSLIGVIGSNPLIKTQVVVAGRQWHQHTLRAIGVLWRRGALEVTSQQMVKLGDAPSSSSVQDKDKCLSKARILGHVMGKIGDSKTVFSLLEVGA